MPKGTVIVMLKRPQAGRVKTRLGRDIGHSAAAWWFRHQTARLLRRIRDPRWHIVLAVAPDVAGLSFRNWPADLPRLPQGSGDLGARMARAMRAVPHGPVCVIGGDIPGVTPAHLALAFRALGTHDAVFGPAEDGGYWLTGQRNARAIPRGIFAQTRWSTAQALADSVASLKGQRIAYVDRLADIDTMDDLKRLQSPVS